MDARTRKRIGSVAHIKSKPYYKPIIDEPDPVADNCSTRMWKFKMKLWVETLKSMQPCDRDQLPRHGGAAPDVTAGIQRRSMQER